MFQLIELSSIVIACFYLYHAYKHKNIKLFIFAGIFALLTEDLSISLFSNEVGGYVYNDSFSLYFHHTPAFIVLFWASIIYSSYYLLKPRLSFRQFLFLMPLSVLSLDIVLDIVAVDYGLWTWFGFEGYTGILSIPPSNYLAWLVMPFAFILTYRYFHTKKWYYLQPFFAFILFLALTMPLFFIKKCTCDSYLLGQWIIFLLVLFVFILLAIFYNKKQDIPPKLDPSLYSVRIYAHLFSFLGIVALGLYQDILVLILFMSVLVFEIFIFTKIKKQTKE